jgi:TPR repeat protein
MMAYRSSFAQADLNEGLQAFDAKNYKEAFNILSPYAQKGNYSAQSVIGLCYQYGLHVTTNNSLAKKWLILAAEQ